MNIICPICKSIISHNKEDCKDQKYLECPYCRNIMENEDYDRR